MQSSEDSTRFSGKQEMFNDQPAEDDDSYSSKTEDDKVGSVALAGCLSSLSVSLGSKEQAQN